MPFVLAVVSENGDILTLCQELLAELHRADWIVHSAINEVCSEFDLCIWDFHPDTQLRTELINNGIDRHLFLVHRNALDGFRKIVSDPHATVLLKPVTRSTLRAFLEHRLSAISDSHPQTDEVLHSLRRNVNDIVQCLIEANLKLQEYDQERTNFLARAVHDFRAPLTAISGYCDLLLSHQLGYLGAEQRDVLQRIADSTQRLSGMTASMLQLSMGHLNHRPPELRRNNIRTCVESAVKELMPLVNAKEISIASDVLLPPMSLYFERAQIHQVFVNLIDNACRFTPRRGNIRIKGYSTFWDRRSSVKRSWEGSDRRLSDKQQINVFRVDIDDVGPGIPNADLEGIFEEYTSYSGGHDRSGGGLGLAICRWILQRHGGHIWAENLPSGGARFSFILPFPNSKFESDFTEAEIAAAI